MAATASDKVPSNNASTSQTSSSTKSHFSSRKHKAKCDAATSMHSALDAASATAASAMAVASEPSTSQRPHIPQHSNQTFDNTRMPTTNDQNNNNNDNQMRQRRIDFDVVPIDDAGKGSGSDASAGDKVAHRLTDIELKTMDPLRSHRRKQSIGANQHELAEGGIVKQQQCGCIQIPIEHADLVQDDKKMAHDVSS